MTQAEYLTWVDDFAKRFPDVGNWLRSKPATMQLWFDDCFSGLELRDCRAVSIQVMRDGLLGESWARDRIPATYLKKAFEVRHERTKREEAVVAHKANPTLSLKATWLHRGMWACCSEVMKLKPDARREFIDQFFDEDDPILTAEQWVDDPSELVKPKRDKMFAEVPSEEEDRQIIERLREETRSVVF